MMTNPLSIAGSTSRALALGSAVILPIIAAVPTPARAAIVVDGADGSDGALNITEDTVIDLSLAVTAAWDASYAALAAADPERDAARFEFLRRTGSDAFVEVHPSSSTTLFDWVPWPGGNWILTIDPDGDDDDDPATERVVIDVFELDPNQDLGRRFLTIEGAVREP